MSRKVRGAVLTRSSLVLALSFAICALLIVATACEDLASDASTTTDTSLTTVASEGATVVQESVPTTVSSTSASSTSSSQSTTTTSLMQPLQPQISMEAVILPTTWTRYEETDSHLSWLGMWQTGTGPVLSGGSYRYVNENHAGLLIEFQGTQIRLICYKSNSVGKAELALDNGSSIYVDLYASQAIPQATVWTSGQLTYGTHTLLVGWTGIKNPASTNTFINIDAVEVKGTLGD